jgi:hypothetical protein
MNSFKRGILSIIVAVIFSMSPLVAMKQDELNRGKKYLWILGQTIVTGALAKAADTKYGRTCASYLNYTQRELDTIRNITAFFSVLKFFSDDPMIHRWSVALPAVVLLHKLWSSYAMQETLLYGLGSLGEALFPKKCIEDGKAEYAKYKQYIVDLEGKSDDDIKNEGPLGMFHEKGALSLASKKEFVENYARIKHEGLSKALVLTATAVNVLPLVYEIYSNFFWCKNIIIKLG